MGYDQNHCNNDDQDNNTANCQRIFHQLTHTIFKEGYRFAHNILLSFFFISCFFKFFQIHLKTQRRFLGHLINAIGFAAHCFLLSYSSVILGSISL